MPYKVSLILPLRIFGIICRKSNALNNMCEEVKQPIQSIVNNTSNFSITQNRAIQFVVNNFKKIHLNSDLFGEFHTIFYNDKSAIFGYIFRLLIKYYVNNISHPEVLKYCNSNLDESEYDKKFKYGVGKLLLKKKSIFITVEHIVHPLLLIKAKPGI